MSESGYYPPGAENDPRAPYNQTDILETDAAEELHVKRIEDINGYFVESLTEASDQWLAELSTLVKQWFESPQSSTQDFEILIGKKVAERVVEYCSPSEDDVEEYMNEPDC